MEPLLGDFLPARRSRNVDFPAPDGPRTAVIGKKGGVRMSEKRGRRREENIDYLPASISPLEIRPEIPSTSDFVSLFFSLMEKERSWNSKT